MSHTALLCLLALAPAADRGDAGWLKLFDGETTFGWKVDGDAKVEKGILVLGGRKETKAEVTTRFADYVLEVGLYSPGGAVALIGGTRRELKGALNGRLLRRAAGHAPPLQFVIPAGTKVEVRKANLLPDNLTPLFDGKSLAGWKAYRGDAKRQKSEFTVKDGVLHVKNGPGDLATEKLLDDFVLQLDCKTNGKHLNSGIFFRAIPGQYQNGYEAQIHNDFTLSPPRKYSLDLFDPKTHKRTGKREVLSAAKDFGTGAIYRRVPARKAMAKDGEWFTLTVVARGRHMATWVNGVQQVDWVDNRPAHENPRNGYREKAGAISIQGHDPTTDLSFRNIRHAPLPRPR